MAMEMLRDIESETVDFVPNFDGYEQQPVVLPSRFPNLLVNGSGGIAVGMATNIPPHNLGEVIDGVVHYLDNPESTPSDLMKFIKAPDFPTGATIMGRQGIRDAYETGRGSLKVRAVAEVEESSNGKNKIVVTQLPYQVNKARLAEKIADLVKMGKLKDIADLKDESNREGMRLVIETKRGANPQVVLNQLYKQTQLQDNFGVIMLALVDGVPRTLNLAEMVGYYVDHQVDVVTRRTRYDLRKAEERDHIVLGLLIALDNLDEVIKIIRGSQDAENARTALMQRFELSEIQANHILDMPLRRLTRLARTELEKEHEELLKTIDYLNSLLADPVKLRGVIKDELLEIRKKHADGRRTQVKADVGDLDVEDLIAEEDVVITVSRAGYVKRLPMDAFKSQGRGGKGVRGQNLKEEDVVKHVFTTTTHHWMLFFTTKGRVYRVKAHEIPEFGRTARGLYAANLPGVALDADEKVSAVIDLKEYDEGRYLLFATKKGIVKKTALPEYDSPRTGLIAINLRDGRRADRGEVHRRQRRGHPGLAQGPGDPLQGVARPADGPRHGRRDRHASGARRSCPGGGHGERGRGAHQRHRAGVRQALEAGRLPGQGPRRQGCHRPPAHEEDGPARRRVHRHEGPGHVRHLLQRPGGPCPGAADPSRRPRQPGRAHDAGGGRRHRGGHGAGHHADGRGRRRGVSPRSPGPSPGDLCPRC